MADVGVGSWVAKVVVPALPIVAAVVAFLLSRFGQDELQRQRSVSETRIKRLEALEKALSVTDTAKSKLGIDVIIYDLQGELQRIVHEFADPIVLSREALEEWINNRYVGHPSRNFTVPVNEVRTYRGRRRWSVICMIFAVVMYVFVVILSLSKELNNIVAQFAENEARRSSTSIKGVLVVWGIIWIASLVYFLFCPVLTQSVWSRRRLARRALRTLRAMSESGAEEEPERGAKPPVRDDGVVALSQLPEPHSGESI
jgi:hypothetical protein